MYKLKIKLGASGTTGDVSVNDNPSNATPSSSTPATSGVPVPTSNLNSTVSLSTLKELSRLNLSTFNPSASQSLLHEMRMAPLQKQPQSFAELQQQHQQKLDEEEQAMEAALAAKEKKKQAKKEAAKKKKSQSQEQSDATTHEVVDSTSSTSSSVTTSTKQKAVLPEGPLTLSAHQVRQMLQEQHNRTINEVVRCLLTSHGKSAQLLHNLLTQHTNVKKVEDKKDIEQNFNAKLNQATLSAISHTLHSEVIQSLKSQSNKENQTSESSSSASSSSS